MATVLLLHGDGTNGSTTVLDEVGHAVTVNGNAQISTAQSKFGGSSILLDGTGDYLNCGDSADFELGAGDWTLECWVRLTGYSNGYGGTYRSVILGKDASGARAFHWAIQGTASSWTTMMFSTAGTELSVSWSPSLNTWYHVAACKSGSSLRFFVDGTQVGATQTHSSTVSDVSTALTVGGMLYTSFEYYLPAYVDEVRITKGEALYTADFTPPTQQYFYNNTVLLLHGDGTNGSTTILDETGKAITVIGNAQISTAQSKFGGSALLFDGTGDYLTLADSVDWDFTGDFTIELWFRTGVPTQNRALLSNYDTSSTGWLIQISTSAHIQFNLTGDSTAIVGSATMAANTWYHLAVCRVGSTVTQYINGVADGSVSSSASTSSTQSLFIGRLNNTYTSYDWNGYLDDIRICKAAKYTADFTPPTSAHDYEYTKLLIHADGVNNATGILEETGRAVTVSGNAKISTTQFNFGGSAMYFDGSGDYLAVTAGDDWAFGTGGFTIEGWTKSTTTGAYVDWIGQFQSGGNNGKWDIKTRFNSTNNVVFTYHTGSAYVDIQCSPAVNVNDDAWHHIAVCRTGGNILIFVDGVLKNTTAISGSQVIGRSSDALLIGYNPTDSTYYTGYIDEIRVSKGIARYTADFTPATVPFTLLGQYIYTISGLVRDDTGAFAARTVRLYRRDTGALVSETTSNGTTGAFSFSSPANQEYYVVFLDDDAGTQYNAKIYDRVTRG